MTKAPRRPVRKPAGGGALRFARPRGTNGQFIKLENSEREDLAAPPIPIDAPAPEKPIPRKRAATPEQLVVRVTRAIERELAQIESIVGGTPTEADKRVRTLASLARTLAEVKRLRAADQDAKAEHDDAVPRNLDEFRRELERRLAQLVDRAEVVPDRGDDSI